MEPIALVTGDFQVQTALRTSNMASRTLFMESAHSDMDSERSDTEDVQPGAGFGACIREPERSDSTMYARFPSYFAPESDL
jgi:hypothetical protein